MRHYSYNVRLGNNLKIEYEIIALNLYYSRVFLILQIFSTCQNYKFTERERSLIWPVLNYSTMVISTSSCTRVRRLRRNKLSTSTCFIE